MSHHVMPFDRDAERDVLSCILKSPKNAAPIAIEQLAASDFYDEHHAIIFDAVAHLYEQSGNVDLAAVKHRLADLKKLAEIGGIDMLLRVIESAPSAAGCQYYVSRVKGHSRLRSYIDSSEALLARAYNCPGDIDSFLDDAEQRVFECARKLDARPSYTASEVAHEIYAQIERGESAAGLSTGLVDLDTKLRGMKPANMVVVAGRPSMGKSILALNIADHVARDLNVGVAFFSLEMSRKELTGRLLAGETNLSGQDITEGKLSTDDFNRLHRSVGGMSGVPLHIIDQPGLTLNELRARSRRLVAQHDIGLIVVDYLQLLQTPGESRYDAATKASNGIKQLASELELPIVAVSQLNRGSEGRPDRRPVMSDLKETGAIEQDADMVLLIHREAYHNQEADANAAEVIIAKHRNGATGKVNLYFDGRLTRFRNRSHTFAIAH